MKRISVLSKLIYKFSAISKTTPTGFSAQTWLMIIKFIWRKNKHVKLKKKKKRVGGAQNSQIIGLFIGFSFLLVKTSQAFFFFPFSAVLGVEPKALCILSKCFTTELYP
jgi:uncharacterized membrane protein YczE